MLSMLFIYSFHLIYLYLISPYIFLCNIPVYSFLCMVSSCVNIVCYFVVLEQYKNS